MTYLYIMDLSRLSNTFIVNSFTNYLASLYIFFMMSFERHKFFYYYKVHFIIVFLLWNLSKKNMPTLRCKVLFSSKV